MLTVLLEHFQRAHQKCNINIQELYDKLCAEENQQTGLINKKILYQIMLIKTRKLGKTKSKSGTNAKYS